jgi:hypothetical protein
MLMPPNPNAIDAHRGGREQIFKKLVNKNAIKVIKPKIGDPLAIFFLKALTPL